MACMHRVCVVGAANVDIGGVSSTKLIYADSNPGVIKLSPGGVGRNIAENLARLGCTVEFITALGGDVNAHIIRESSRLIGLDISNSLTLPKGRTSTYVCVSDCDGEIAVAVNDMAIYDNLTPEFLVSKLDIINRAELVIADANLPSDSIKFIAENCTSPVVADTVSVKKSTRIAASVGNMTFIKPNRAETEALTGVAIKSDADLPKAAEILFKKGLKIIFISLGGRGVYYDDGNARGILPCFKSDIVNTTGCGDAFVAGAALALLSGAPVRDMAKTGLAAASACAQSDSAVNPKLSLDMLRRVINASQEGVCLEY